jgi:hypothetical protein
LAIYAKKTDGNQLVGATGCILPSPERSSNGAIFLLIRVNFRALPIQYLDSRDDGDKGKQSGHAEPSHVIVASEICLTSIVSSRSGSE